MADKYRYRRLLDATEAFADDLSEGKFAVSFQIADEPGITVVLDRYTLERLRDQIAHVLRPQG